MRDGHALDRFVRRNVRTALRMIRGVANCLESVAAILVDMEEKATKIMTTSSVPKFNAMFLSLKMLKDIEVPQGKECTVDMLLSLAKTKYVSLFGSGE